MQQRRASPSGRRPYLPALLVLAASLGSAWHLAFFSPYAQHPSASRALTSSAVTADTGLRGYDSLRHGGFSQRMAGSATTEDPSKTNTMGVVGAVGSLIGAVGFWTAMYCFFYKFEAIVTKAVSVSPRLEVASFVTLAALPLMLVRWGLTRKGVDPAIDALRLLSPTAAMKHLVGVSQNPFRRCLDALLIFMSVNLLASAAPEGYSVVLPEALKVMDPDGDGILTAAEFESVAQIVSRKFLLAAFCVNLCILTLASLKKPEDYEPKGDGFVDTFWRGYTAREPLQVALYLLISSGVILVTLVMCLRCVGVDPITILTFGGVGGIAFGLAAQNLVGNFISGLLLIVNKPFRVGDIISSNDIQGRVARIGWLSTHVETADSTVILPNSSVVDSQTENFMVKKAPRLICFTFTLQFGAGSSSKIEEILAGVAKTLADIPLKRGAYVTPPRVHFQGMIANDIDASEILCVTKFDPQSLGDNPHLVTDISSQLMIAAMRYAQEQGCTVPGLEAEE